MNPGDETQHPADLLSRSDADNLDTGAANAEMGFAADPPSVPTAEPEKEAVQPHDFRTRMLLPARELRKLRMHQEEFVNALAARLSNYLRLEFTLKLTDLQTVSYGRLAQGWPNPSHLSLFKIEPLRGISILEVPLPLGLSIVDRLMGGPGEAADTDREVSEIENALLDQAIQIILGEWCSHWVKVKELKPVLLGYETNGKFVQTAVPETMMLVVVMEACIGACTGQIQIAFPYSSLEILIRGLNRSAESVPEAPAQTAVAPACKWNPSFDDVCIPVVAEWQGVELTARELLALKVGDVLKISGKEAQHIKVRLGETTKFNGRLGTVAGNWAVELTEVIKR
jgi:flagellar motor switch protein FliM